MIDLNKYKNFVKEVTSNESNFTSFFSDNLVKLETESKVKMAYYSLAQSVSPLRVVSLVR